MKNNKFTFLNRHIGPSDSDIKDMLKSMKLKNIDDLIEQTVPRDIYSPLNENLINTNYSEDEVLKKLKKYAQENTVLKSFIMVQLFQTLLKEIYLKIPVGILNILHIKQK